MPRPACRDCEHVYRRRLRYNWSDPVHCRLYEKLNDGRMCTDVHEHFHKGTSPTWCPKEVRDEIQG